MPQVRVRRRKMSAVKTKTILQDHAEKIAGTHGLGPDECRIIGKCVYLDGETAHQKNVAVSLLVQALFRDEYPPVSVTVILPPYSEWKKLTFEGQSEIRLSIVKAGGSVGVRESDETFEVAVEKRKRLLEAPSQFSKPEFPRQLTTQPDTKTFESHCYSDEERRALQDAYNRRDDDSLSVVS